jgi:AcrR family transcriptional regulator
MPDRTDSQIDIADAGGERRGITRRRQILQALHDCVIENGYAKTTLADIARTAGMSPSHLLYYFEGKDAILEEYFDSVAARLRQRINGFRGEPVKRQIELLADLFFSGKGITRSEIGFMLECFGAAVHDSKLHRYKMDLDRFCKAHLRDLFRQAPNRSSPAKDCAEVAYAMLIGLRTAAYFDERLTLPQARRLFRAQVRNLAQSGRAS